MDQAVGAAACRTDALTFQLADPDRRLAGVRLVHDLDLPGVRVDFGYRDGAWRLSLPHPAVWRLEYRLELAHPDGGVETVCDPGNPKRVGGAFGDRSVLECPDYREPGWLDLPAATYETRDLTVAVPALGADLAVRICSPPTATDRILLAHDGPEYDRRARLGHYSAALVRAGALPPHHLVLLTPGEGASGGRDEWYSANPAYSRALVTEVLPRIHAEVGTGRAVVGMGASLGALAMLHAQRRYPAAFAGLFLQSGSFFRPRYDRQESGFKRYLRIVRFAGRVVRSGDGPPVPAMLTCGAAEENVHNNRDMAQALRRQGYPVDLAEVRDAHNVTAWRDALDPHLTNLLHHVWGTP
jgi:enterochelin esterase family protein